MSILVFGGTGTVGRHVVRSLLTKGEAVRVLTRSADHADVLPLGATGIIGDLRKAETLRWAMKGIDRVFLVTPLSPTETEEGRTGGRGGSEQGWCSARHPFVGPPCGAGSVHSPFQVQVGDPQGPQRFGDDVHADHGQ